MAATARAKTAPARRQSAPARRRPAPARRRRSNTPVGGFVPVAVGAVGGLADSGIVMRLTRSRLWIGLLAMMLVGIVALNVVALQFSASSSEAARQADELRQANSALRGDIATMHSNDKIAAAAAELGLATPAPGDFRYLKASGDDAAEAARRLRSGELTDAVAPVAPAVTETVATETSAAPVIETAPVEVAPPVAEAPVAEEPVAEAPVAEAAAPSQSSTPASGGGVSP